MHSDKEGNLAVIAVVFKAVDKNAEIEQEWANMPEKAGKKDVLPKRVDASKLLPHNHDYYRLNGSLTTPPSR